MLLVISVDACMVIKGRKYGDRQDTGTVADTPYLILQIRVRETLEMAWMKRDLHELLSTKGRPLSNELLMFVVLFFPWIVGHRLMRMKGAELIDSILGGPVSLAKIMIQAQLRGDRLVLFGGESRVI